MTKSVCYEPGTRFRLRITLLVLGTLLTLSPRIHAGEPGKPAPSLNTIASELIPYANALGRRLRHAVPGKVSATGSISNSGNLQNREPIRIAWEYPLKINIEWNNNSLGFDRSKPNRPVFKNQREADSVEMLLEDSAEGFFALQPVRTARRFLGSGYKLEGSRDSDPGMDLLVMTFPDMLRPDRSITKSYWFNSRTKLLGLVAYTTSSGVLTNVIIDDWRNVAGENIPFRLERWENNKLVTQISLDSVTVSTGAEDGTEGGN